MTIEFFEEFNKLILYFMYDLKCLKVDNIFMKKNDDVLVDDIISIGTGR